MMHILYKIDSKEKKKGDYDLKPRFLTCHAYWCFPVLKNTQCNKLQIQLNIFNE